MHGYRFFMAITCLIALASPLLAQGAAAEANLAGPRGGAPYGIGHSSPSQRFEAALQALPLATPLQTATPPQPTLRGDDHGRTACPMQVVEAQGVARSRCGRPCRCWAARRVRACRVRRVSGTYR
jgi:hypothetical protein